MVLEKMGLGTNGYRNKWVPQQMVAGQIVDGLMVPDKCVTGK